MERWPFERLAGVASIAAAVAALAYSITYIAIDEDASFVFFLLGSILAIPVFVALYQRLRVVDEGYAMLGLVLGVLGSFGAATHGGYRMAVEIHDPGVSLGVPYPTDPRGLASFGLTGLAVLVFAALARRGGGFDPRLAALGLAFGAVLVLVYIARVSVREPDDVVVLVPAVLAGVIGSPAWYFWLGRELLRRR